MLKISKKNIEGLLFSEETVFSAMEPTEAFRVLKELILTGKSSFKSLKFEASNGTKNVNGNMMEFVQISSCTKDIYNYYYVSDMFGIKANSDFEEAIKVFVMKQELLSLGY